MTISVSTTERRYVEELLAALRGPCASAYPSKSDLVTEEFAKEFQATLLLHHYFLRAPLATNSFEAAFVRAGRAAGHSVQPAPDGQRFWDVEVGGRKISLKSTAQKSLRMNTLHISKLCEAAWIQDMRGALQREERTKSLFSDYTRSVDSIIQLRLFRSKAFYEMVEIPSSLLAQVQEVPRTEFSPDGPSIGIPVGQDPPDFTLKLDRSDSKVTLANINKSVCSLLATWQLDPRFKGPVVVEV